MPAAEAVRVFFNAPILAVRHEPNMELASVGKVMRRNDILEVTIHKNMNAKIQFVALSDQNIHVVCVDKWH